MNYFNNDMMPPMNNNYSYYPSTSQPTFPLYEVNPFIQQTFPQNLPFSAAADLVDLNAASEPPAFGTFSQLPSNNDLNGLLHTGNPPNFNITPQQTFQTNQENKSIEKEANFLKSTPPTRTTRKAGKAVPEEKKDTSYWEKRNKNNISAKRSRESRRNRSQIVLDEIVAKTNQLEMMRMKNRFLMEEERMLRNMYAERGVQCPY